MLSLAETLAAQIGLIIFGFGIERLRPARSQGIGCVRLNIAYGAAARVVYAVLYPLSVGLTTLLVNALGGGLIELPASGVGYHSALPEHHNCNFNQFFPVFDVLCGTYRQPGHGEYPPTGLGNGDVPQKLHNMLLWPWRQSRAKSMSMPNA